MEKDEDEIESVEDIEDEEDYMSQSVISIVENTNSRTETTLKNTLSEIKQKTTSPTISHDL